MPRVLLTGGCGFVGHHVALNLVEHGCEVVILDKLTYASLGLSRLRETGLYPQKVKVFTHDLAQPLPTELERELGRIDVILHLAAETHVDRSIENAEPFVVSNVLGTLRMLELARRKGVRQFLYFGTDEVFGPAPAGVHYKEDDRYRSGNPYAASKAGAEELAISFHNTYRLPVVCVHTMNIFGERQHPEKFIPKTIADVQSGTKVTIHADTTRTISGSRFYLYASDLADAVRFLMHHGVAGEKYNIVGQREVTNLDVARAIADEVGKPLNFEMVDFHASRPGHDLRYALDGTKLASMGWKHAVGFDEGLRRTVKWYSGQSCQ